MTLSLSTARDVVAHPARYAHLPSVFGPAFAIVAEARGLRVDLDRVGQHRHLIAPAETDDLSHLTRPERIRALVHRHAETKGIAIPSAGQRRGHPEPPDAA